MLKLFAGLVAGSVAVAAPVFAAPLKVKAGKRPGKVVAAFAGLDDGGAHRARGHLQRKHRRAHALPSAGPPAFRAAAASMRSSNGVLVVPMIW